MSASTDNRLIDLSRLFREEVPRLPIAWLGGPLSWLLKINAFNQAYSNVHERLQKEDNSATFFQAFLEELDVSYDVSYTSSDHVPEEGPVIAVSNHPFGCLEGIVLGNLLETLRPGAGQSKLLANYLLNEIPEIRPSLIAVDPFESRRGTPANIGALKRTISFLRDGGALGTFPSGAISHFHWSQRAIVDPPWQPDVSGLARRTNASVVPVYFEGRNSLIFQTLGMLHPSLRTGMMLRELMNKKGTKIRLRIGRPIRFQEDDGFDDDQQRTSYLRLRTYALAGSDNKPRSTSSSQQKKRAKRKHGDGQEQPVIAPIDPALVAGEIEALPSSSLLAETERIEIRLATAGQIPNTLKEIGRLREVTFREVGEGSGKDCDLDSFDSHYKHLFLWNKQAHEIGGAYRLGPVDEILEKHGPEGLYTTTLFKFQPEFLEKLNPAMELGRSFIRKSYQRKYNSLFLLWKGILTYVCHNPRYNHVFGPVSISKEYNAISKNLLVQFLRHHFFHPEYSLHVRPRNPFRTPRILGLGRKQVSSSLGKVEHVSALISDVEEDGKGIPILIRQYLKMNASLLSFNLDPEFSDVLDGLILIDLTTSSRRLLNRYMGQKEAEQFLAHHGVAGSNEGTQ